MLMDMITSFKGKYFFLSNFYPIRIYYEYTWYPSAEHAYVAAKTLDKNVRKEIAQLSSAAAAKKFGRTIEIRPQWDQIKIQEMRKILELKFCPFRSDVPILSWLQATAPKRLVEVNWWGDCFWGECPEGVGRNELGNLLMSIRDSEL
jgi:ribA/ribD-fused uncharacterized protein